MHTFTSAAGVWSCSSNGSNNTFGSRPFFGTSQNAVKTQIWIAISVYLLVAILKKELKIDRSLGEILQILSITLFEKVSMDQVLKRFHLQQEVSQSCKQLILFEFEPGQ